MQALSREVNEQLERLREALIALGYQSSEAARMVGSISPLPEKTDEIIRMALKGMLK